MKNKIIYFWGHCNNVFSSWWDINNLKSKKIKWQMLQFRTKGQIQRALKVSSSWWVTVSQISLRTDWSPWGMKETQFGTMFFSCVASSLPNFCAHREARKNHKHTPRTKTKTKRANTEGTVSSWKQLSRTDELQSPLANTPNLSHRHTQGRQEARARLKCPDHGYSQTVNSDSVTSRSPAISKTFLQGSH